MKVLVAQSCPTFCDPTDEAPLSMGFSRQEYCSGLPFPSPGDLPNPGMEPRSAVLWADSLPFEPPKGKVKVVRSCPAPCSPMDCHLPHSSVHGTLQARTLEWVTISFSNACMHAKSFSHVCLCATPWTAAHQAPLSTGFSRQEDWSGSPFPSPRIANSDLGEA